MLKDKILNKTEDVVYFTLSIIAILFVIFEIIDLIYVFYLELATFSFEDGKSSAFMGVPIFFNIIIVLELLETFKNHHNSLVNRIKIIILVALTAVVRKIIIIDVKHTDDILLYGIAALVLSLCLGYYFLSKDSNDELSTAHKKQ